jgi:hypothetical protein
MEEAVDTFVKQHGTIFHQTAIEEQISFVKYKYEDQLIEMEFYAQKPHQPQVRYSFSNFSLNAPYVPFFYID